MSQSYEDESDKRETLTSQPVAMPFSYYLL